MNRKRTLSTQVCHRNDNQKIFNTKLSYERKKKNKCTKPYSIIYISFCHIDITITA